MRLKTYIKLLSIGCVAFVMGSCLKGDPTNFPEGAQHPFLIMDNNAGGGANNPVSGLDYFGNQSLGYPHSDVADTTTFYVALEGTGNASHNISLRLLSKSLSTDLGRNVLNDNYKNDSINYLFMPDSIYHIIDTVGTIAAGSAYATFKVAFFPSKFDQTKNYMLPISVVSTSDPSIKPASNYGIIYYHAIGNVLTATYHYSYHRWNRADSTGTLNGTDVDDIFWAPANPTTLTFNGGYAKTVGLNAPYQLTFKQDPITGNLSNFKVTIDASLAGGLAANGITITQDPSIIKMTITPTYRYFKIWYKVNNGTADRTLMDEYWWP